LLKGNARRKCAVAAESDVSTIWKEKSTGNQRARIPPKSLQPKLPCIYFCKMSKS